MKKAIYKAAPWLTALAILLLWEGIVAAARVPMYLLPAPSDILRARFGQRILI